MSTTTPISMIGLRFGRLLVLERAPNSSTNQRRWLCLCDCGDRSVVRGAHLRGGNQVSCGCYRDEITGERTRTHRMVGTPEHNSWRAMNERCYNQNNKEYKRYGGSGIQVYEPWRNSFEVFLAYVGLKPSPAHSIDRYPNGRGNYEPGNVRWATPKEQAENSTNSRMIEADGERMNLSDWARRLRVPLSTIKRRLKRGVDPVLAVTTPSPRSK